MVMVDFDDDLGKARVSVTNTLQIFNQSFTGAATGGTSMAGVSMLAYDVSILAAIPE